MDTFWEVQDPLGYQVSLSSYKYEQHIVGESGHTDITPSEIMGTIENPIVIYQSSRHENSKVYFSRSNTYSSLYTKVAVDIDEKTKTGMVSTAFVSKHIGGGIKEDGLKYANYDNGQL